ncbi:MAG: GNAT family N-acetyltransferase [Chloroflexi bacterium]|nr:GNAT family N-acetyltransferase [Chloroflexota bacterium]
MIVRTARADELDLVADMQMGAFAPTGQVLAFRPRRAEWLREHSALHQVRVVEDDGRVVAALNVVTPRMRVGVATVPLGGLSGVVTVPDSRWRGYARALLEDTLAYMREQAYPISTLNGIPGFYHRFGYTPVMPEIARVLVPAAHAAALEPPANWSVRPYVPEQDRRALMVLTEAVYATRTGSILRDEAAWRWQDSLHGERTWVAVHPGPTGVARGYVRLGRDESQVHAIDGAWQDPAAGTVLLRALGDLARDRFAGEVSLSLPPDAPQTRRILRDCGGLMQLKFVRGGGWMARVLDVPRLCARLTPELARRLEFSPQRDWRGCLRLETDEGAATLFIVGGQVSVAACAIGEPVVCRLPQTALIRLVFGSVPVSELLDEENVAVPEAATPLLAALFPPGHAFIAEADGF